METYIVFIKANVAFVLFYAFYRLFFNKDTFFRLKRVALWLFYAVSILYPFLHFQNLVQGEAMEDAVLIYTNYSTAISDIVSNRGEETSGVFQLVNFAWMIYPFVMAILLARFLMQLFRILHLVRKTPTAVVEGVKVRVLPEPAAPFSFFGWIFIHPDSFSERELHEILAHECTHMRQRHSIDVIFCELACIVFWINPFVWLFKREVRMNLEYLADNSVVCSGYDTRQYQYHLLALTYQDTAVLLSNRFACLPLKKRVKMMNKRRTHSMGRLKYVFVIPLTALFLFVSNIEAVARMTEKVTEKVTETAEKVISTAEKQLTLVTTDKPEQLTLTTYSVPSPPPAPPTATAAASKPTATANKPAAQPAAKEEAEEDANNYVFQIVENMPEFQGGETALFAWLNKNIRYPVIAQENGISGRVTCQFVVNVDGTITDVTVLRGVEPSLDKEAMRVIRSMPKWKPGEQRGKPVRVSYRLPVTFRLN